MLGLAVAAGFIIVETVGVVLLQVGDPELAYAALYLVGIVVVSAVWGLALGLATAVASGAVLMHFAVSQATTSTLLSAQHISILTLFVAVAVTTHFLGTWRRPEAQPTAPGWTTLGRVAREHQTRRRRIGASMRVVTVVMLFAALAAGKVHTHWISQLVLVGMYAALAIWAMRVALAASGPPMLTPPSLLVFALADIAVVFGFELLSEGGVLPLLMLALVPLILVPQVSWRGAAVLMVVAVGAFVVAMLRDTTIVSQLGWARTVFVMSLYAVVCSIALVAAYVEERHFDEIAGLIVSREALLASTMSATDELQRSVAESIHDGALQDIMVARQELLELAESSPGGHADRALASLAETTTRLREAIFELHPVVVQQLGLGPAIEQLARDVGQRAGITIRTSAQSVAATAADSILFGVCRELLSNAVRHSRATEISVRLDIHENNYRLEVADNGIGLSPEIAATRIAQGHIGLASHRARVEAAHGSFTIVDQPVGTRIQVEIPLSA